MRAGDSPVTCASLRKRPIFSFTSGRLKTEPVLGLAFGSLRSNCVSRVRSPALYLAIIVLDRRRHESKTENYDNEGKTDIRMYAPLERDGSDMR